MIVQEWLGKDNKLGIDIWTNKYQYKNETFDEWLDRVSNKDEDVKKLILEKKFLFGGRILSNRGLDKKGIKTTLSNCYVITPPEDNIESIFDCAKKLARTYSYGGGCGIDISKLAPRGAKVRNTAKETSGSVSFMDLYSLVTGLIGQNGRRGALMISISCEHPDVEEFIEIKSDLEKVTKANISVRITDAFMNAVKNRKPFKVSFTREETNEVIEREIDAYQVFHKLCEMNWDYAEPGMLFWDRIENYNLLSEDDDFHYAGTNPCLVGETLIHTTRGEIQIKDLVGKNPMVYCMDENGQLTIRKASKVWKTRENAQIVCVETSRGSIKCTPDHLIHTRNRGWVAASELKRGDKLTGLNRTMKDETHVAVGLSGSKYIPEHRLVASAYYNISGKDVHHKDGDTFNNTINNLEVLEHSEHSRITNTDRHIEINRDEKGRFVSKTVKKKRNSINLGCGVGTNWVVQNVTWLKELEDVYDMTVPEVHNFVANRIVVHNCAEEPLPSGGSCLLSSINLAEFVTEEKKFDFEEFRRVVAISVKALNDVLDEGLPLHPLQEQRDSVRDWRQIGLGIFGLADMLIKMNIRYGSKEAIDLCDSIGYVMANEAIETSNYLAEKNYGCYPKYNADAISKSEFFKKHTHDFKRENILRVGLCNSQLLTIAPTGSLSSMLGVSGGIEPIYANYYERKTESLHGHDEYYKVYTPIVKEYMDKHNIKDDKDLPDFFVTAQTLNYKERIEMQSVWQKHIDASISSTVNVPNNFSVEDTENLYMYAWEMGLKGVTIFRDGCKRGAILSTNTTKKETDKDKSVGNPTSESSLPRGYIMNVSDDLIGYKRKLNTGCGSIHMETYFDELTGEPQETFINIGSSGGCERNYQFISRLISLALRAGVPIESIIDQAMSIRPCSAYTNRTKTKKDTSKGTSCPSAIGYALKDLQKKMSDMYVNDFDLEESKESEEAKKEETNKVKVKNNPKCPECGEELAFEGGCNVCKSCGWSKCD